MSSAALLFAPAALLAAAASWWIIHAYARAGGEPRLGRVTIGCSVAAIATLALYLVIGRPNQPDAPYAGRIVALEEKAKTDVGNLTAPEMLAVLEARAKADPTDFRALLFAGQILSNEGRDSEAARAFRGALKLEPNLPDAMIGLARSTVRLEGAVSPQMIELLQTASTLAPDDPLPWFYQALAASQEERFADAARLWPEVLKRLEAGDPRRTMAQSMLDDARSKTPQQPGR